MIGLLDEWIFSRMEQRNQQIKENKFVNILAGQNN